MTLTNKVPLQLAHIREISIITIAFQEPVVQQKNLTVCLCLNVIAILFKDYIRNLESKVGTITGMCNGFKSKHVLKSDICPYNSLRCINLFEVAAIINRNYLG